MAFRMELIESDKITFNMAKGRLSDELYFFVITESETEENYAAAVIKDDLKAEMSTKDFLRVCAIDNNGSVKIFKVFDSDLDFVIDLRDNEDNEETDLDNERDSSQNTNLRDHVTKKLITHVADAEIAKIDKKGHKLVAEEVIDVEKVYNPYRMHQEVIIIGTYDHFAFTMHDYECLGSHEWLTDNTLDFSLYYIHKFEKDEKKNSTFVGTLRLFNDYKNFKKCTETKKELRPSCIKQLDSHTVGINIFKKEQVFIPVLTNDHWRLMYATYSEKNTVNLHILCSMHTETPLEIIIIVQLFFNRQYELQNNGARSRLKFKLCRMQVPKQTYGDCGIFVIAYFTMLLSRGEIGQIFFLEDVIKLRKTISKIMRDQVVKEGLILPKLDFTE